MKGGGFKGSPMGAWARLVEVFLSPSWHRDAWIALLHRPKEVYERASLRVLEEHG